MDSVEPTGATEIVNLYSSTPPPEGTAARLSYEGLLASASEHFTGQGLKTPLDQIARDAGVDSSTLSHWFPTREHLIVVVNERHIQKVIDKGTELSSSLPPDEAAVEWIRFVIAEITSRRELIAAIFTLQAESGVLFECCIEVAATATKLLDRAKAGGTLRTDVDARDVVKLIAAVAFATETDAGNEAERFMRLILDGLKPRIS